jgi:radical SAM protein with 4Fe4S-binding SPASM domain
MEDNLNYNTFCSAPFMELHISVQGNVIPCCIYDETKSWGNIKTQSLKDIYNSDNAVKTRDELINGIKHKGCDTCWKNEETHNTSYRDCHKTGRWLEDAKDVISTMNDDYTIDNLKITRLDLRFDNKCNLKCRICGPRYSTSWYKDDHTLRNEFNFPSPIENMDPYSESVSDEKFKELLILLPQIRQLFFAGGEPLIQDKHYEMLQYAIDNDLAKNISIVYNTNFSKLTYKNYNVVDLWKHFDHVIINASLDDSHKRGMYQRTNIDWDTVIKNRETILPYDNVRFSLCPTISILNVLSIIDFIEEWIQMGYLNLQNNPNFIYFNILDKPHVYNIKCLPNSFKNIIREKYEKFFQKYQHNESFQSVISETQKVISVLDLESPLELTEWKRRFDKFNGSLDIIRNEDFYEIYPEFIPLKNIPKRII